MNDQEINQYLKDAGCEERQRKQFLSIYHTSSIQDQVTLLRQWRKPLMDKLHESQEKVDCMDFLLYKLRKGE